MRHHEIRSYGKHRVHEPELCAKQIHQRDANDVDDGKTEDVYWQPNRPTTKVLPRLYAKKISVCFSFHAKVGYSFFNKCEDEVKHEASFLLC